jgi:hypothetical protein
LYLYSLTVVSLRGCQLYIKVYINQYLRSKWPVLTLVYYLYNLHVCLLSHTSHLSQVNAWLWKKTSAKSDFYVQLQLKTLSLGYFKCSFISNIRSFQMHFILYNVKIWFKRWYTMSFWVTNNLMMLNKQVLPNCISIFLQKLFKYMKLKGTLCLRNS